MPPCQPATPKWPSLPFNRERNRGMSLQEQYDALKKTVDDAVDDVAIIADGKRGAGVARTRLRKAMQEAKVAAQGIRVEVIRKDVKE